MPAFYQYYQKHDTGIILAFRENDGLSLKEKLKNKVLLKRELLRRGIGVVTIESNSFENGATISEELFFVVDVKNHGVLKQNLIDLGLSFGRDSIIFSEKANEYHQINVKDGFDKNLGAPKISENDDAHMFFNSIGYPNFKKVIEECVSTLDKHPTEIRSLLNIDASRLKHDYPDIDIKFV